jgi:hypothetical protein
MRTKGSLNKPKTAVPPQRTPSNDAPKPSSVPLSSDAPKENRSASEPPGDPRVALVYYKDADGNPDFARMQERVKENFRKFYENPNNRKMIGLITEEAKPGSAPDSGQLFGQDEVTVFYDGLQFVDAIIAAKLYGVPFDMAQDAFTFTEFQRQKLSGPSLRVLNKWGPKILAQWKDEIGLGIVLFSSVAAQSRTLKKLRRGLPATPAAPAKTDEPETSKVSSISDVKPSQPRTTPERVGTASPNVDLENEVGFHLG